MKCMIVVLMLGVMLIAGTAVADTKQFTISAADSWSDTLMYPAGYFNVHISGTWVGTVTLQRRMIITATDATGAWLDMDTWTANDTNIQLAVGNEQWRIGCDAGEYTSGTVTIEIGD